jgi:hypothetical protein
MANKEEQIESRVLSKMFTGTLATLPASDPETTPITFDGEGWESYYDAASSMWLVYNIQTIDLSGYQLQDKTLFPQGVLFQDLDTLPVAQNMGTAVPVKRASIVSTTPINEIDLRNFSSVYWHLPGSMGSTHLLANILSGRIQTYLQLDTFAGLQPVAVSTWGAGDSTAGSKLWLVEAYIIPGIASLAIGLPDSAVVIPATIFKEADLEYMMRLARSLEPVY